LLALLGALPKVHISRIQVNVNGITAKLSQIDIKSTTLSTSTKIKTLQFAEDQVIIADSDDNLHRGIYITKQQKILEWKYH
jgi:hypothetical protein